MPIPGIMQSVAVWESASTSLLESITFHDPDNEALTWITGDVSLKAPKAEALDTVIIWELLMGLHIQIVTCLCQFHKLSVADMQFLSSAGTPRMSVTQSVINSDTVLPASIKNPQAVALAMPWCTLSRTHWQRHQ